MNGLNDLDDHILRKILKHTIDGLGSLLATNKRLWNFRKLEYVKNNRLCEIRLILGSYWYSIYDITIYGKKFPGGLEYQPSGTINISWPGRYPQLTFIDVGVDES